MDKLLPYIIENPSVIEMPKIYFSDWKDESRDIYNLKFWTYNVRGNKCGFVIRLTAELMDRVKDDIIEACIRYFVQHISIPILLGDVAGPEISEGREFVKYTYQDII